MTDNLSDELHETPSGVFCLDKKLLTLDSISGYAILISAPLGFFIQLANLETPCPAVGGFAFKEMKQIHIQDDSGDKKYFTIIPNYILNHSTANDQALYLQMKRIAGDGGKCSAGVRYFQKQLKLGHIAIRKSMKYLIKHKWITYLGKEKVETSGGIQEINTYKVNDIWPVNNEHNQGVSETDPLRCVQNENQGVSETAQKKNIYIKKNRASKLKPYFRGMEMREAQGKLWCLPKDGGEWLEFAGNKKEIVYN